MTVILRKLAVTAAPPRILLTRVSANKLWTSSSFAVISRHFSGSGDGEVANSGEFEKWSNGGGLVHKSAQVDPTTVVETGAVVHSSSVLGPNVHIQSGVVVGPEVTIRQLSKIGYNAVLSNCSIGDSCVIYNGVCIGQDGFGFYVDENGNMVKKPQVDALRKDRKPCGGGR